MSLERVRAGTGIGRGADAFEAGRAAAAAAVSRLGGEPPALVLVFATPRFDLHALLRGVRSVTGTTLLVGSTGSGEIVEGELVGLGSGVGVLALTAGRYRFGAASVSGVGEALEDSGRDLARRSRAQVGDSPYAAVVLLADSTLGDLQGLAQGVYRVGGPKVAIVGGGAGDEYQQLPTMVLHGDQVLERGAVALWVASDVPLKVVTHHGWKPHGIPMLVTRAEGTRIQELGGRPAVAVYEEQLGLAPGELPAARFLEKSIRYPFGLLQPDGSTVIRLAISKTDDGQLNIHGCLPPPGSAVQVMTASIDALLRVGEEVVPEALAARPEAGVLLAFSCAARAAIFGARAPEEPRLLQRLAGEVPTFGFYCHAEFARTSGVLATHNATLTALAL